MASKGGKKEKKKTREKRSVIMWHEPSITINDMAIPENVSLLCGVFARYFFVEASTSATTQASPKLECTHAPG